jgi:hypothetical protein
MASFSSIYTDTQTPNFNIPVKKPVIHRRLEANNILKHYVQNIVTSFELWNTKNTHQLLMAHIVDTKT